MIGFLLASSSKRLLGRFRFAAGGPRRRRRVRAGLEGLEARTVLSTYTMPLVNNSHLNADKYAIFVAGFSTASGLTLQPGSQRGELVFAAQTGTVSSYEMGRAPGDDHRIQFDSSQNINGGRVYIFVVPRGQTPPSFPFGQQPANPPGYSYLYTYVELTNPGNGTRPTVNLSTVDGFSVPATLELNDNLGKVGQPPLLPHVNRQAIINEYDRFMGSAAGGGNYKVLELPRSPKADGQSEGLLNPYFYLAQGNPLPQNVASPLNTVFDGALNTLFTTSGWSLAAVYANTNTVYTATAGTYQYGTLTNPVTGSPVMLAGLQFQGGGNTFHVFNPVGVNIFVGANGQPITASTYNGQLNQITLTNAPADGVLQTEMYVFGQYFDQANGAASNDITGITSVAGQTVVTLKNPLPFAVTSIQVAFSPIPYLAILQLTSGEMVFGNTGFFADGILQGQSGDALTTLGNIENQMVSALNRGVAVVPGPSGPLSPSSNGYATQYWGTETNWYPAGQPENLFSWFLHTGTIGTDPIFLRPPGAVADQRGSLMGSAYGFGFDENPGPVPPAPPNQPEVPSKFDPVSEGATRITITLDPWLLAARHRGARRG